MHFSPKILGLNVGIFGTVFGQSWTDFRTVIGLCVLFLCVIAKKNEKHVGCVKIMLIYAYMMY